MENLLSYANFDIYKLINDFIDYKVFNNRCECGWIMNIMKNSESIDGYCFMCPCGKKSTLRKGSWLAKSHLKLSQIIVFIQLWTSNCELKTIQTSAGISFKTAVKLNKFFYELVVSIAEQNSEPIGGRAKIVEIAESKFGKRKYHKGHRVEGQWVFGGVERGSYKSFMVSVDRRDEVTLLPLIKRWIHPESIIISDCWAVSIYAYLQLIFTNYDLFISIVGLQESSG